MAGCTGTTSTPPFFHMAISGVDTAGSSSRPSERRKSSPTSTSSTARSGSCSRGCSTPPTTSCGTAKRASPFPLLRLLTLAQVLLTQSSHHTHSVAAAIILDTVYGLQITGTDDAYVDIAQGALNRVTAALLPGAFAVNTFPVLRHIPAWSGIASWRFAKEARQYTNAMVDMPYAYVKAKMVRLASHLICEAGQCR